MRNQTPARSAAPRTTWNDTAQTKPRAPYVAQSDADIGGDGETLSIGTGKYQMRQAET